MPWRSVRCYVLSWRFSRLFNTGIPIIATLQNDYLGDKILKVTISATFGQNVFGTG